MVECGVVEANLVFTRCKEIGEIITEEVNFRLKDVHKSLDDFF